MNHRSHPDTQPTASRPVILLGLFWYSSAMHAGIARFARENNWILNISLLRSQPLHQELETDGAIGYLGINPEFDRLVAEKKLPMVTLGFKDFPNTSRVSPDSDAVGRMAVGHFQERGLKRVGYYQREGSLGELEKMRALQKYAQQSGLEFWLLQRPSGVSENNQSWLSEAIQALPKPIGLLAEFDDPAIEILYACHHAKITVPNQVAVLGVDNDWLRCEFAPVPLSSIDDDHELIGYEAARLLNKHLLDQNTPNKVLLVPPRGVITRQSTDMTAIDHRMVVTVLQTIREQFTRNIGAKEVAATVPMSYRRLHDAFLRSIGHSISDEITLQRIRKAQELLIDTDKKGEEIARLSGFTSQDRMGKVFRRVLKISPDAYRHRFKARNQIQEAA